ncbi:hypothetical protein [uncultured Mucilaginibacter sp.]|uniref:hypothetical protein n=1 Tax=uncultured Mucilaginibacter sp. TaxID=797541 RepID=UPI002600C904|nr:hypothetical protein [uncultured Mucilaginibacter sp.]
MQSILLIESVFETISGAISLSLFFVIPMLFIVRVTKLRLPYLNTDMLIVAINITLLMAALLHAMGMVANFVYTKYDMGEHTKGLFYGSIEGISSRMFYLGLIANVMLPQLMWFKKIRRSVKATYFWFSVNLVITLYQIFSYLKLIRKYMTPSNQGSMWVNFSFFPSWSDSIKSLAIFLVIVATTYLIILRRRKKFLTDSSV